MAIAAAAAAAAADAGTQPPQPQQPLQQTQPQQTPQQTPQQPQRIHQVPQGGAWVDYNAYVIHDKEYRSHVANDPNFGFMSHIAFPADGSKVYNLKTGYFLPAQQPAAGLSGPPQRQRRPVNLQRALIDDLKTRLANGATYQQLGFTTEEQGRLFILSKERLMDPHPDRSDYRSIPCTILAAWLEDPIRGWRRLQQGA